MFLLCGHEHEHTVNTIMAAHVLLAPTRYNLPALRHPFVTDLIVKFLEW
jgi:hypothetical protein